MAIKSGQILHSAQGFVIDRIQTGGAGNVNIPEEKIYELGNFKTVATVRDIPDLSFDLESFDVSCEVEALLTGVTPSSVTSGQAFDFGNSIPLDIISPFKSGNNIYSVVKGVAIPYLTLERAVYRFGLRQNATQQFTLRGDSIYYLPGAPYYQEYTNTGATTYSFANTAIVYEESATNVYALCVVGVNTSTHAYKRLFVGQDYTNTASGFTMLRDVSATYNKLRVVYGSLVAATYPQSVHEGVSVKPAGVRGKDIDVYIGTNAATPVFTRWTGVQSVEVTRAVNIQNDEEFGNHHYVASEYDVADVTGSITVRPYDPEDLYAKVAQVANVATTKVVGPFTSVALPVEIRIADPDSGVVLKTLYIPDARFKIPGVQGRVQQKTDIQFAFTSDTGELLVYNGHR